MNKKIIETLVEQAIAGKEAAIREIEAIRQSDELDKISIIADTYYNKGLHDQAAEWYRLAAEQGDEEVE